MPSTPIHVGTADGHSALTEPRIPKEYQGAPIWDRVTPPQLAVDMVMKLEDFRQAAYLDSVGKPTIGWGSTRMPDGSPVKMGQTLNQDPARQLLREQMLGWCAALGRRVKAPLTENMASAMLSWTHNLGENNLQGSMLAGMLNAGAYDKASWQLGGWRMERGPDGRLRQSLGLARRRELERRVFAGLVLDQYNRVWKMNEQDLAVYYKKALDGAHEWTEAIKTHTTGGNT